MKGLLRGGAFKIVPGDLGTKGGMRADARARVLTFGYIAANYV